MPATTFFSQFVVNYKRLPYFCHPLKESIKFIYCGLNKL
jgi:hypothetical protein